MSRQLNIRGCVVRLELFNDEFLVYKIVLFLKHELNFICVAAMQTFKIKPSNFSINHLQNCLLLLNHNLMK